MLLNVKQMIFLIFEMRELESSIWGGPAQSEVSGISKTLGMSGT